VTALLAEIKGVEIYDSFCLRTKCLNSFTGTSNFFDAGNFIQLKTPAISVILKK
jgi:hypothetical protein